MTGDWGESRCARNLGALWGCADASLCTASEQLLSPLQSLRRMLPSGALGTVMLPCWAQPVRKYLKASEWSSQ